MIESRVITLNSEELKSAIRCWLETKGVSIPHTAIFSIEANSSLKDDRTVTIQCPAVEIKKK
jgi:hypothetical protein